MMRQVKGQSLRCPSGIDETGTDAFCCRNEFSHLTDNPRPDPGSELDLFLTQLSLQICFKNLMINS